MQVHLQWVYGKNTVDLDESINKTIKSLELYHRVVCVSVSQGSTKDAYLATFSLENYEDGNLVVRKNK